MDSIGGVGSSDLTPSETRLYLVVDRLRDDLRREIDLRLMSEADARHLALVALERKTLSFGQITTLLTSLAALVISASALWFGVKH